MNQPAQQQEPPGVQSAMTPRPDCGAYQMTHETLEEISDEEWEYTFATNISAMFYLVKAALPHHGCRGRRSSGVPR